MLALEVEFLTGNVVATDRVNRQLAEWPPHPQRLFSALVAAWAECDLGDEVREALEWLQRLDAPELRFGRGHRRDVLQTYVPVNDTNEQFKPKKKGPTFYPTIDDGIAFRRNRQERTCPTVALDDPRVHFLWRTAEGVEVHRASLERVAAEVAYVGHSSSLVRVAVVEGEDIEPTWHPAEPRQRRAGSLRVPSEGRLQALLDHYDLSRETNRRIEPPQGLFVDYASAREASGAPASLFGGPGDWFLFQRWEGQPIPLSKALQLTWTVRRALVRLADDAGVLPNELLTGHRADGSPIDRPHMAILPLAFVGHPHATGEVKGFAIVLPDEHESWERKGLLRSLDKLKRVFNGREFEWSIERVLDSSAGMQTLDAQRWIGRGRSGTARYWATVTPAVFGHHPGRRFDSPKTMRVIGECCEQIGLPEPRAVYVSKVSKHRGVPPAAAFDTLTFDGKPSWLDTAARRRLRAHVALEFDEPVSGPVILGAGRYYGMGLCKPWFPQRAKEDG